jgi:hypothetical protein
MIFFCPPWFAWRDKMMNKNAKIYLTVSLTMIGFGIAATLSSKAAAMPVLYVPLPVGAAFFGLFLISTVMDREAEQFNAEQQAIQEAAERHFRKP